MMMMMMMMIKEPKLFYTVNFRLKFAKDLFLVLYFGFIVIYKVKVK